MRGSLRPAKRPTHYVASAHILASWKQEVMAPQFLLTIAAVISFAVLINEANSAKLPLQLCCTGGQNLAGLIYDYSDHFTEVMQLPDKEMCSSIRKDVNKLKDAITNAEGCQCNLVSIIESELEDVTDACAYSLSFIRALFDIVAMSTEHLDESWNKEAAEFKEQIEAIDSVGIEEIKHLEFEASSELKSHPRVNRKRLNKD